jgi:hypothetical protein
VHLYEPSSHVGSDQVIADQQLTCSDILAAVVIRDDPTINGVFVRFFLLPSVSSDCKYADDEMDIDYDTTFGCPGMHIGQPEHIIS